MSCSVVELLQEGASGLSVLRTFRLLRILKLVRFMPALKYQLVVMLKTMDSVATFCALLVLFIFIFRFAHRHLLLQPRHWQFVDRLSISSRIYAYGIQCCFWNDSFVISDKSHYMKARCEVVQRDVNGIRQGSIESGLSIFLSGINISKYMWTYGIFTVRIHL